MSVDTSLFDLMELRRKLMYVNYDKLGLKYLNALRSEVETEYERRTKRTSKTDGDGKGDGA